MRTPLLKTFKAMIVDDEVPARRRLADLLRKVAKVSDIIEAADGNTAVRLIASERPDVVFLDIQLPGQ